MVNPSGLHAQLDDGEDPENGVSGSSDEGITNAETLDNITNRTNSHASDNSGNGSGSVDGVWTAASSESQSERLEIERERVAHAAMLRAQSRILHSINEVLAVAERLISQVQ